MPRSSTLSTDSIIHSDQRGEIEDPRPFRTLAHQLVEAKLSSLKKLTALKATLDTASSEYYGQTIYQEKLKRRLNMLLNQSDAVTELEAIYAEHDSKIIHYEKVLRRIPEDMKESVATLMIKSREELKKSVNYFDELMGLNKIIVEELKMISNREWSSVPQAERFEKQEEFIKRYGPIAAGVSDEWYELQSLESLIELANQTRAKCEERRVQTVYDLLFKSNPVDEAFYKIKEAMNKHFRRIIKNESITLVDVVKDEKNRYCLTLNPEQLKNYHLFLSKAKSELDQCRKSPLDQLLLEKQRTFLKHDQQVTSMSKELQLVINDVIDDIAGNKLKVAADELNESAKKEFDPIHEQYVSVIREFADIDTMAQAHMHLIAELDLRVDAVKSAVRTMEQYVQNGQVREVKECQADVDQQVEQLQREKTTILDTIEQLRKRLKSTVVDKMKQAFGRYEMIKNEYGHSPRLLIAQQEVQHMRSQFEKMNATLAEINHRMMKVDADCQDIHQDQFEEKIKEATRVQHDNIAKQMAANDMLDRIRFALVGGSNLQFWSNKVRYFGGTANGDLKLPDGIDQIAKILSKNQNAKDPARVLEEIKAVAIAMNNKPDLSWKGFFKYEIACARHFDVSTFYQLASELKPDPRDNRLDLFDGIAGLTKVNVPRSRPERP